MVEFFVLKNYYNEYLHSANIRPPLRMAETGNVMTQARMMFLKEKKKTIVSY